MWQPGWEESLAENGYIYRYGWVSLFSAWNYHNIVNGIYSNIKEKVKKVKQNLLPPGIFGHLPDPDLPTNMPQGHYISSTVLVMPTIPTHWPGKKKQTWGPTLSFLSLHFCCHHDQKISPPKSNPQFHTHPYTRWYILDAYNLKWKWRVKKLALLNIQKTKIMESGPITSWEIDGETMATVSDFIFRGLRNHCRWWLQPWN